MTTEHLVFTGRSGVGVSTTAANLSAALAEQGFRVAHLGYDQQRISSYLLRGQSPLKAACGDACKGECNDRKFHCAMGFQGILCIECGADSNNDEVPLAPEFANVRRMKLMARFRPDFVVHDVAGDPGKVLRFLRNGGEPTRIFVVTSASFASLTTVNQFLHALAANVPEASRFGGIISNNMSGSFFEALVEDFARQAGTKPITTVPHSLMVSVGEYWCQTVIESAPKSYLSSVYRKLARFVAKGDQPDGPHCLSGDNLAAWQRKWCEITEELESGMVRDGAAI